MHYLIVDLLFANPILLGRCASVPREANGFPCRARRGLALTGFGLFISLWHRHPACEIEILRQPGRLCHRWMKRMN